MKKLLIATAELAMVACTAQAQSSVTVYGVVVVNVMSSETNNGGANTAMGENGLATSRLGFRGTEDLGGGLKAEFQLESGLKPTTGAAGSNTTVESTTAAAATTTTNSFFSREAWVGLSSSTLGSVRFGKTDLTSAQGVDSTVGQMGNLSDAVKNIGTDTDRTVRYTTPTFAGFSAQLGYSNGASTLSPSSTSIASATSLPVETTGTTSATDVAAAATGSTTSVYAQYEAGKLGLYAGVSNQKIDATHDNKETVYGAKYDFGVAAVGAYYSTRNAVSAAAATVGDSAYTGDFTQTIVSVSAPVAALGSGVKVHAVYYKNEFDDAAETGNVDGYKLAITKALSKRTSAYAAYIDQSDNKTSSTAADVKGYVVGVTHTF
jgi:predicted porin